MPSEKSNTLRINRNFLKRCAQGYLAACIGFGIGGALAENGEQKISFALSGLFGIAAFANRQQHLLASSDYTHSLEADLAYLEAHQATDHHRPPPVEHM